MVSFIKSEILIAIKMGWLVSSDKWKAPLDVCCSWYS